MRKISTTIVLQILLSLLIPSSLQAQDSDKVFRVDDGAGKLSCLIDYSQGCFIKELLVNGRNVLRTEGVNAFVQTPNGTFSSAKTLRPVELKSKKNLYQVQNIQYGGDEVIIDENWSFIPAMDHIICRFHRTTIQ